MSWTYWNIGKANAEIERLRDEITKRQPSVKFDRKTRQFNICKANEELDDLRAKLTALGAPESLVDVPEERNKRGEPITRLAVPPHKVFATSPKTEAPSLWAHITDGKLREKLQRDYPGGPSELDQRFKAAMLRMNAAEPTKKTESKQETFMDEKQLKSIASTVLGRAYSEDRDPALQLWQAHVEPPGMDVSRFAGKFRQPLHGMARIMAAERNEILQRVLKGKKK